jgi:hypothetical protein
VNYENIYPNRVVNKTADMPRHEQTCLTAGPIKSSDTGRQHIADQVDCATSCCFLVVHSLKVHQQLKMANNMPVRCFSVAFCGSYVTYATQEWPKGAPTERYCRLIEAAKRSKRYLYQEFDDSLSVSSTGLHLSVTGKSVEFELPLSRVKGCKSYWSAPVSLLRKEGAIYVNEHYPVVFELVTRLNEAEGTLLCHLLICQEKAVADALFELVTLLNGAEGTLQRHLLICQEKAVADALSTSTHKQMKRRRPPVKDEPHGFSSLISRIRQAAFLVAYRLKDRHFNYSSL